MKFQIYNKNFDNCTYATRISMFFIQIWIFSKCSVLAFGLIFYIHHVHFGFKMMMAYLENYPGAIL